MGALGDWQSWQYGIGKGNNSLPRQSTGYLARRGDVLREPAEVRAITGPFRQLELWDGASRRSRAQAVRRGLWFTWQKTTVVTVKQWWTRYLFSQAPIWTNGLQGRHSYRSISTLSHCLCQAVIQILAWVKKGVKGARSLLVQALRETPRNPAQRSLIQLSVFIYIGIYLTHSSYSTMC